MITILDNWYSTNLLNTDYEDYISDTLFCNDRQLQSEVGGEVMGTGYGTSLTCYAGRHRLEVIETNKTPSLKCGLKNDRFTVDDITIGNGALTYPIGLLTSDEITLAGMMPGYMYKNHYNYLSNYENWWSLTPDFTNYLYYIDKYESGFGSVNARVDKVNGVRPVISIKSDVRVTGAGTMYNPYKVVIS